MVEGKQLQDGNERETFLGALDCGSALERTAYLEQACGGDAGLRQRVDGLLADHFKGDSFMNGPAAEPPPTIVLATPLSEGAGTMIGRYKLLEKIGEGGFGAVYVAEQREPVKRRVALKIIKLGLDTRQVVARFEAERQALALMDQPNIAKVLDAGATETGRPYFVMELVRGIPITQYCDEHQLCADERLRLFMLVCQAIQHAHQKGIIHRDIKPSNILVTVNDGVAVPKVIDFGIAKATQGELTEKTVYTQFQQFIGTPAYMSPEQADMTSLDIDTRSDIYALGVLLYELLVGKTPFDAKELLLSGMEEMRRTICEQEPIRPSTRLESLVGEERTTTFQRRGADMAKFTAILRGDVDWIVMKCLEKDRTRRYETANGLAADIKRYLANEPVIARPPSQWYRLQKLACRNKAAFAAVTSVVVVLVLGIVVSSWQAIRATRAEGEAVEQRKLSDMQLALQAWEEGDLQRAADLVDASRPVPGQLPGFEWRYLWKLCQDQSQNTFGDPKRQYGSALFLGQGVLLLSEPTKLTILDPFRRREQVLLEDKDGIGSPTLCSGNTNLLATITEAGHIKVWDFATRRVRMVFEGQPDINGITFSQDGRWLASASWDHSVKLWDVQATNRTPARTIHRYSYVGSGVAFSPDGSQLFSSGSESDIRSWDIATGAEAAAPLEGHTAWGHALVVSPDGLWMASGGGDSTVIVWNLVSRKLERRLLGHIAGIHSLAFSPNGQILASGSLDRTIRLWDLKTGQQLALLRGHRAKVTSLNFSPDGEQLVSRSDDGLVKLWQTTPGPEGNALTGIPEWLQDVTVSPDEQRLASVALDSFAVNLWDLPTRSQFVLTGHTSAVMGAAFSPDGRTLATGSHDQTVRLWDVSEHKALAVLTNGFPVGSLAFCPDGGTLIVGGSSFYYLVGGRGGLQFWDVHSQQAMGTIPGDSAGIVEIALSAEGTLLATAHTDCAVSLWDAQSRRLLHHFPRQFEQQVLSLAFSPTEPLLAASDTGGNIVLYNTTTLEVLGPALKAHTSRVMSLAFSPDGRTLASGGEGGGLKLWHVATRQVALTIKGHVGSVCGIAFSRDGNLLASCGADATVRLWLAATPAQAEAAASRIRP